MSINPDAAPYRPAFVRDAASGLYYRIGGGSLPVHFGPLADDPDPALYSEWVVTDDPDAYALQISDGAQWYPIAGGGGGGSGPAGLAAEFTWSPTNPVPGQAVTFTSTSTGSPTGYSWVINGTLLVTRGPHTTIYETSGTFEVELTVSDAETFDTATHNVNVVELPAGPGSVTITTTGATFSPEVELIAGSTATVTWKDAGGATLATGIAPTINFGSAATRTVTLEVSQGRDVRVLNLGYYYGDDLGREAVPESYNHPAQPISGITALSGFPGMRYFLAARTQLTGHLDLSGCVLLTFIECYQARVQRVTIAGCSSLRRFCLEQNAFGGVANPIDLNPARNSLYDMRCAESGGVAFVPLLGPLPILYHWCLRDNSTVGNHPPITRMPMLAEYLGWSSGNSGTPSGGLYELIADNAVDVRAAGNTGWTTFDDTGRNWTGFPAGTVTFADGGLTTVNMHTGSRWDDVNFSNNPGLSATTIDAIINVANSWGTSGGILNLSGCAAPTSASSAARTALASRGWTVTVGP